MSHLWQNTSFIPHDEKETLHATYIYGSIDVPPNLQSKTEIKKEEI